MPILWLLVEWLQYLIMGKVIHQKRYRIIRIGYVPPDGAIRVLPHSFSARFSTLSPMTGFVAMVPAIVDGWEAMCSSTVGKKGFSVIEAAH